MILIASPRLHLIIRQVCLPIHEMLLCVTFPEIYVTFAEKKNKNKKSH